MQNNSSVLYYVASNDEDCLSIMHHECHMISYYLSSNTTSYFPSNITFIFLPGIHVLPNNYMKLRHFNWLTLKGHLGAGTKTPELYNITLVIQNCYRITIKDLKITYTIISNNNNVEINNGIVNKIILSNNTNVEINSGIMNKFMTMSSTFMTNISIYDTKFSYSVILDNAKVILHNVTVLHNKSFGIYINKMGNLSSLTNVTVKCNACIALFLKGQHSTSHINIKEVVIGGKIYIEHIYSHLSLSNVKVTVYQKNPCHSFALSIKSCGNNISITDVLIVGAQITISNIGSHFIFKNVTIIGNKTSSELTLRDVLCSLLSIEGGINSKHVNIISVKVVDGSISLFHISYDLSITNIYTNLAIFVGKNGPLISIVDSFIIGKMFLMNNDNKITLMNITVGYRILDIDLPNNTYRMKWNVSALFVATNGNDININNITLYNGLILIMNNGNKITIQSITIDVNATFADTNARRRLFLDPKYKVELSGLVIAQNKDHITIDNVKMSNSILTLDKNGNGITLSNIYIHTSSESHGVTVKSNGDNTTLSDITVDGYGEVFILNNGVKHDNKK